MRAVLVRVLGWLKTWGGWLLSGVVLVAFAPFVWLHRRQYPGPDASGSTPDVRERMAEAARPALLRAAEREHEAAKAKLVEAHEAAQRAHAEREAIERATPDELLKRSEEFARRKRQQRARRTGPLAVAFALLVTSSARAEDIVPLDRGGVPGYWVERETWRDALADAEGLPVCELRLDRLHTALAHRGAEVDALAAARLTEQARAEALAASLDVRTRERDQARRERDVWWRSPWMISISFTLGAAASAWGAYALVVR